MVYDYKEFVVSDVIRMYCSQPLIMFFFFSEGDNNLELGKKGFDNLANKDQGEQQKIEEENQEQEKPQTQEETSSCEHQDQRERLEKESQADAEQKDGTKVSYAHHRVL